MNKELLAALKRIEAIAHYYGKVAGHSDEITDAFKSIVDEAGGAIALVKEAAPDMLNALVDAVEALTEGQYYPSELRRFNAVIAKAKGN